MKRIVHQVSAWSLIAGSPTARGAARGLAGAHRTLLWDASVLPFIAGREAPSARAGSLGVEVESRLGIVGTGLITQNRLLRWTRNLAAQPAGQERAQERAITSANQRSERKRGDDEADDACGAAEKHRQFDAA